MLWKVLSKRFARRCMHRNVNATCQTTNSKATFGLDVRFLHAKDSKREEYNLRDFMKSARPTVTEDNSTQDIPYLNASALHGDGQKIFFDVYGCQMNVNDADVVWAILQAAGYQKTSVLDDADIVLIVTCAIRDGAERRIWNHLRDLSKLKKQRMLTEAKLRPKVGILGCMAERLKTKVLEIEKSVDLVAGPDSYKDLPRLLALTRSYRKAVNVLLSLDETYADVMPVRLDENSVSSFVSIMRGCNNMCTYCIVPFTRGRERSRPNDSILDEVRQLSENGVREVTLLGQNVNSYRDVSRSQDSAPVRLSKGFKTVYKLPKGGILFAELLDQVANIDPEMRIRFTSPHPKDFPDEVLDVIKSKPNICKSIHLPAQSGNNDILQKMRRGYTREMYLELVKRIRGYLPCVTLSSDFILGFCGETEEQFQDTLSLVEMVGYNVAYVFAYSMREKTAASRRYVDDVSEPVKLRRVAEVYTTYRRIAEKLNKRQIGEYQLILVEGNSKRSELQLAGRNDGNIKVIVPRCAIPQHRSSPILKEVRPGDYVCVKIDDANSQVLKGIPLYHTTIREFHGSDGDSFCESNHLMWPSRRENSSGVKVIE